MVTPHSKLNFFSWRQIAQIFLLDSYSSRHLNKMNCAQIILHFTSYIFIITCSTITERQLHEYLLMNYSTTSRPVREIGHSITVGVGVKLVQLFGLSESEQHINSKFWLTLSWVDNFLKWNPQKWGMINNTRLNHEDIWTPDIHIIEEITTNIVPAISEHKTPIIVDASGTILWYVPVNLKSSCTVNVDRFPFDVQICNFTFMSWSHDSREIDLKILYDPVLSNVYINSTEWTIIDFKMKRKAYKFICCPNEYAHVIASLTIERKPAYYISNIVIPCIVQMVSRYVRDHSKCTSPPTWQFMYLPPSLPPFSSFSTNLLNLLSLHLS